MAAAEAAAEAETVGVAAEAGAGAETVDVAAAGNHSISRQLFETCGSLSEITLGIIELEAAQIDYNLQFKFKFWRETKK